MNLTLSMNDFLRSVMIAGIFHNYKKGVIKNAK